jgi:hypothetical protein
MDRMRLMAEQFGEDAQGFGSGGPATAPGTHRADFIGRARLLRSFPAFAAAGCDKASPAVTVMLHLRARYVSKAAILTLPVCHVLVENRSPA